MSVAKGFDATNKVNLVKIKRAIVSVFDKTGVVELCEFLAKNGVEIFSTGGTFKLLAQNNIKVQEISDITNFPEIMDGRVKTLHPLIHGGLLGIPDDKNHLKQMKENSITKVDLLVVNLYPFYETFSKYNQGLVTQAEVIENIDIGGPSMLRSAAKNFAYTTVLSNYGDYTDFMEQCSNNDLSTTLEYRKQMAKSVFDLTGSYDAMIAEFFKSTATAENQTKFNAVSLVNQIPLRYGENAHQKATAFELTSDLAQNVKGILQAKKLQGKELSYNNIIDLDCAFEIVSTMQNSFSSNAVTIIKHANPCGLGIDADLKAAYIKALNGDPLSAFGGIVGISGIVDFDLAKLMTEIFYEAIICYDVTPAAAEVFAAKKNLRVLVLEPQYFSMKNIEKTSQIKSVVGGLLMQSRDANLITAQDLEYPCGTHPSPQKLQEVLFSINSVRFIKSNGIAITKGTELYTMGCGQTSRVDAVRIACYKAFDKKYQEIMSRPYFKEKLAHSMTMMDEVHNQDENIKNKIQKVLVLRPGDTEGQKLLDEFMSLRFQHKMQVIHEMQNIRLEIEAAMRSIELVLASDAFFPFADSIKIAAEYNINTIIAPSGSIKDSEVVEAAKKYKVNLIFCKTRHFRH